MGWADTWNDILEGGSQRWKITCNESHQKVISRLDSFLEDKKNNSNDASPLSVFCPLAGDDPIVHLLWKRGYSVTSIDLVPQAVAQMRNHFKEGSWMSDEQEDGTTVWKHDSGRATLYVGDALVSRPELMNKFDAVYDKDSFGALQKDMRAGFCKRISEYTKQGATIYIEVKLKDNHNDVKHIGPPFSLKKEDLMEKEYFGSAFEHVEELGSVYDIPIPSAMQTGHVLRKK